MKKVYVPESMLNLPSELLCNRIFTIFPIKADFSLVLLLALQSFVYLLNQTFTGLCSMEEAAGARFLHHLGPSETSQLAKSIRTVHNGVAVATLSISQ